MNSRPDHRCPAALDTQTSITESLGCQRESLRPCCRSWVDASVYLAILLAAAIAALTPFAVRIFFT